MTKSVKVIMEWTPDKMNGLPTSGIYSTVARFVEDVDWPENAWSVVIEFCQSENLDHKKQFEATARFLVQAAPWDRLKQGCVFDLYEGMKRTAQVTVL